MLTDEQVRYSHLADDMEKMRTSALRRMQNDRALLADALVALRNGDTAVTDEYLDRVLSSTDAGLANLRNA